VAGAGGGKIKYAAVIYTVIKNQPTAMSYLAHSAGDILNTEITRDAKGRLLLPASPSRVNDLVYHCCVVTEGSAVPLAPFGPVRGTSGAYLSDNWGGTYVAGVTVPGGRHEADGRGPVVGIAEYDVLLSSVVSCANKSKPSLSPDR
jgi:hypothetical protein